MFGRKKKKEAEEDAKLAARLAHLGPFRPPTDFELPEPLRAPTPRPRPANWRDGRYARTWRGGLACAAMMILLLWGSRYLAPFQLVSDYFAPLRYLDWLGIGGGVIVAVLTAYHFFAPGPFRMLRDGEVTVARVLNVERKTKMIHAGHYPVVVATSLCEFEFIDSTGTHWTCGRDSMYFETLLRPGVYTPAVYRRKATRKGPTVEADLYAHMGLDPDHDARGVFGASERFGTLAGKKQPDALGRAAPIPELSDMLLAGAFSYLLVVIVVACAYAGIVFRPRDTNAPMILGVILGLHVGLVAIFLVSRRIAALPRGYQANILCGVFLIAVAACGFLPITLNAKLDRSADVMSARIDGVQIVETRYGWGPGSELRAILGMFDGYAVEGVDAASGKAVRLRIGNREASNLRGAGSIEEIAGEGFLGWKWRRGLIRAPD